MEEKLTAILTRIEQSSLSDEEKVQLYALISESLKASIWPSLISSMPKDQLQELISQPGKATVEAYKKLIDESIMDEKTLASIEKVTDRLLEEVDAALKEEHI